MTAFYTYVADISFALDKFGVKPLFFVVIAVFIVTWLAALDVRRRARTEEELQNEIAQLKAKLASAGSPEEQKKKPDSLEPKPGESSTATGTATGSTVASGLSKTRSQFFGRLKDLLKGGSSLASEQYEALEELLISSDLGVSTSSRLLERLREVADASDSLSEESLKSELKSFVSEILHDDVTEIQPEKRGNDPLVVLVVGVNGVGKTTTIGKLAQHFTELGAAGGATPKMLLAACDTFRAAAVEQLQVWGERAGVDVWAGDAEAKPSTVAYQAIHKAKDESYDVLIVDTAGRLHTRVNLMNELENVVQILGRELQGAPHETLLVLDATTGQNALQQAREFNQRASLSGLVVTKLDGTPKGGIVIAIKDELGVPIRYIGVGEGAKDLKVFDASEFVEAMFLEDPGVGSNGNASVSGNKASSHRRVRSRDRVSS